MLYYIHNFHLCLAAWRKEVERRCEWTWTVCNQYSDVSCHGSSCPVQSSQQGSEATLPPLENVQKRSQSSQIKQVKLWRVPHPCSAQCSCSVTPGASHIIKNRSFAKMCAQHGLTSSLLGFLGVLGFLVSTCTATPRWGKCSQGRSM